MNSLVGEVINFRGMVYAPVYEKGVIYLFSKVSTDLSFIVEEIRDGFPDCIGRKFVGRGWVQVRIEFEHKSSNFVEHKHDPSKCDLIVCWEHNWVDCPLEVIELRSLIKELPNYPVKPKSKRKCCEDMRIALEKIYETIEPIPQVKEWYQVVFSKISELDDKISVNIGTKFIGWYLSNKSFISLRIAKNSIRFSCFTRGHKLVGTKTKSNNNLWADFSVKCEEDVEIAVEIITESYKRMRKALALGEPTSGFNRP